MPKQKEFSNEELLGSIDPAIIAILIGFIMGVDKC